MARGLRRELQGKQGERADDDSTHHVDRFGSWGGGDGASSAGFGFYVDQTTAAGDAATRAGTAERGLALHHRRLSGASESNFNEAGWTEVTIPHTWNAQDANDDEAGYYCGSGWYRSALKIRKQYEGKRLFLSFEGAKQVADVYVEGEHVGHHVGGYQAFSVEITDQVPNVKVDRHATIAVRVDNSHDPDIPPLSADFTFFGGMYRNVWLVLTELVHLDLLDLAERRLTRTPRRS